MSDSIDRRVKINPGVVFQVVSGRTVLLDLETEEYFGLDAIGTRIWELLQAGTSTKNVLEKLLTEYSVERNQLKQDLDALLDIMEKSGLIERMD